MISTLPYPNKVIDKPVSRKLQRIDSIDILRGLVMLIMALDHSRHIFHLPAMVDEPTNLSTTTPVLFFTRWITHFCAPVFLFLSGISAFISGQSKTRKELSYFLIKRGIWLLIVETVIIGFSLSFNPAFDFFFLQVIWAIGWSMIILGILIRTSLTVIIIIGSVLFLGHNILDYFSMPGDGVVSVLLNFLVTSPGKAYTMGGKTILVIYAILPWTAIMIGGYVTGHIYARGFDQQKRRTILLFTGIMFSVFFLILRYHRAYGDPAPWSEQNNAVFTLLSFFNVTKYPVSLQYSLMTLGPALIFLGVFEKFKSRFFDFVSMFGQVPFFYYVTHFYLLHLICVVLFFATGNGWDQVIDKNSFMFFRPLSFGFSLIVVYVVWVLVVVLLYFPCRWFLRYKQTHKQWWLSYM